MTDDLVFLVMMVFCVCYDWRRRVHHTVDKNAGDDETLKCQSASVSDCEKNGFWMVFYNFK
jgi:hypothetical protein